MSEIESCRGNFGWKADASPRSTRPRQTTRLRDPARLESANLEVAQGKGLSLAERHLDGRHGPAGRNHQLAKAPPLPIHTSLSCRQWAGDEGH